MQATTTNASPVLQRVSAAFNRFFMLDQEGRFRAFEGLRAWAIVSVFAVHFNADWSARKLDHPGLSLFVSSVTFGHLGVDLFFVLSGFLIYRLIVKTRPTFLGFILNRYRRLLPAHLAMILVSMSTAPFLVDLANAFFLNHFFPAMPSLNFITWSLAYEALFYAVCAVALITLGKYLAGNTLVAAIGACLLVFYFVAPASLFDGKSGLRAPDVRFMAFFVGIAAAIFYETDLYRRSPRVIAVLGFLGLIGGVLLSRYVWGEHWASVQKQPYNNLFYLAAAVSFAALCLAAATPSANIIKTLFGLMPLRLLGIVSYSFYLSHALVSIPLANRVTDQFPGLRVYGVSFALSLAMATAVSIFLFHYLEKPYFRYRHASRSEDTR